MAFLGLKTRDAGLGSSSTVDLLVKALTGDPEREMALARGRADLDLNAYRQRQMEAAAAQAQAEADTKNWELNQRTTNLPVMEKYLAGLVDEPVPVTTPGALPAPAPGLPDPVAVAEPMPAPEAAFTPRSTTFQSGADVPGFAANPPMPIPQGATPLLPLEPVAVEDFTTGPELQPDEDTLQLPQPDVMPGEVIPPSPEEMAAYQREVDAAKARAGLIIAGGGNAAQVGQGLGIGEGIVKTGSDDPAVRSQGNVLYTGSNPPAGGSDPDHYSLVITGEAAKALGLDPTKSFQQNIKTGKWDQVGGGGINVAVGDKLTDTLAKDTVFYPGARNADMELEDIDTALSSRLESTVDKLIPGNWFQSPEYQKARIAGDSWIQNVLRKESGATIPADEMENYRKTYMPQPGDDTRTIEYKRQLRAERTRSMRYGLEAGAPETLKKIDEDFEQRRATRGKPAATAPAAAAPAVGTEDGGYVFQGGDPADPKNWKPKVQ